MKNYFNFNLTGRKFLPIWIFCIIFYIIPVGLFQYKTISNNQLGIHTSIFFTLSFIVFVLFAALILSFFIYRKLISNIQYNDKNFVFSGTLLKYIAMILLRVFLTIITLGIYGAWFYTKYNRFFIDNSTCDEQKFEFKGKAVNFFIILITTVIVPLVIISILSGVLVIINGTPSTLIQGIFNLAMLIIITPYMYFKYKWLIDIKYKNYNIAFETNDLKSIGKIYKELFLTLITCGIYFPLAYIKLYKYFSERTVAISDTEKLRFGYEIDYKKDFLLIWGQTLLTIITLSIYLPWAISKVGKRILSKTYCEKLDS